MKRKLKRKMLMLLLAALLLALTIPVAAAADADDRAEAAAYWKIMGRADGTVLARAMSGEAVPLVQLTGVTAQELMSFAHEYRLPIDMARHGWYTAMAEALRSGGQADARLAPFLAMPENARDKAANEERRTLRKGLTEAWLRQVSAETGLPGGFVAWLMLEDDWYEGDWEDVSEWREGRSAWVFDDHAYAGDMRETYGREAVVTEDDVERTLRQNGVRMDD